MNKNIERQLIGAWGEHLIIKELLENKCELYIPIVDCGIDLIIRKSNGSYIEIQVKTVSKSCKDPLWFQINNLIPKNNFFVICISELYKKYWVIPSKFFYENSNKSKSVTKTKTNIIFDLNLKNKVNSQEVKKFENNLELLSK